jgi:hypothetical protein
MILRCFDEETDFVLMTALTVLETIVYLCYDAEIGVDYVLHDIPQVMYRNRFNREVLSQRHDRLSKAKCEYTRSEVLEPYS